MAYQYSNIEFRKMHFCYGRANGKAEEARRLYIEAYPHRHVARTQTFVSIHRRLGEQGSLKPRKYDTGRPKCVRTVEAEERILAEIQENPDISTRQIAVREGKGKSSA